MPSHARRWSVAAAILPLLAVAPCLPAQQPAQPPAPQAGPRLGIVSGIVRDTSGVGLGDAVVRVAGSGRATLSLADGRFLLDSIPAGMRQLTVSRVGFLPARADLLVPADSAVMVAIALVPDGRRLDPVVITGRFRNRLGGFVLDDQGRPVPGATVSLIGSERNATADSLGAFVFGEIPPGPYLLEARVLGYERARYPVQMREDLDRTVTMRLRTGARALTTVDLHNMKVVARETEARQTTRRRAVTAVITREELAPMGRVGLDFALERSQARELYRLAPADQYCILVDGQRPLGRGLLSLNHDAAGAGFGFSQPPPPPPSEGWLRSFFADEVEMIELYPEDTEDSRTLCGRFTWGSGCACSSGNTNPPTLVIWLR